MSGFRSDFEDDDDLFPPEDREDDDGEDWEQEGLSGEEREALFFNELLTKQITDELAALSNRQFVGFLGEELSAHGFDSVSELILVGMEFDGQYILQFYNVREDRVVKSGTGAGNIYVLIDDWVLKTVVDLLVNELYGDLADISQADLTDCYLGLLLDALDWKEKNGIESAGSRSPEDAGPREDK